MDTDGRCISRETGYFIREIDDSLCLTQDLPRAIHRWFEITLTEIFAPGALCRVPLPNWTRASREQSQEGSL
jgi:hypothetical protein